MKPARIQTAEAAAFEAMTGLIMTRRVPISL